MSDITIAKIELRNNIIEWYVQIFSLQLEMESEI